MQSSSGKSYELVSFAAQQPDATVFLPSGSETKAVGKISRRVCLVRYPEPEEFEKPGFGSLTPSSKKSAGSSRKTMSRFTSASKNRSSQGSALSLGQWSAEPTPKHKKKRERMIAAWDTQTCRESPPKDLKLAAQTATRPQMCRRRQQRNPRRKRRLQSQSSSDASGSIISHHLGEDTLIFPELSAAPGGVL